MKFSILCVPLLILAGFANEPAAGGEGERGEGPRGVPEDFQIELSRTACFGTCPIYSVQVDADGAVRYEGERYVEEVGSREASIGDEYVGRLWTLVKKADFFALDERYEPGHPECVIAATDMPSAVVRVRAEGREHTVHHYAGCGFTPDGWTELARAVDELAGTSEWIGEGTMLDDRLPKLRPGFSPSGEAPSR